MQTKVKLWQVFWVTVMTPPAITCLLVLFGYDGGVVYSHAAQGLVYAGWVLYFIWSAVRKAGEPARKQLLDEAEVLFKAMLDRPVQFTVSDLKNERIASVGLRHIPGIHYLVEARSSLYEPSDGDPRFVVRYYFRAITPEHAKQAAETIRRLNIFRAFAVVELSVFARYVIYEPGTRRAVRTRDEIARMYATQAGDKYVPLNDPVKLKLIRRGSQVAS